MLKPAPQDRSADGLRAITVLRSFQGSPEQFWPEFLKAMAFLAGAAHALLLFRQEGQGTWKKVSEWSQPGLDPSALDSFRGHLPALSQSAHEAEEHLSLVASSSHSSDAALGVKIATADPNEHCVACFLLQDSPESQAREALMRLRLAADTPLSYLRNFAAARPASSSPPAPIISKPSPAEIPAPSPAADQSRIRLSTLAVCLTAFLLFAALLLFPFSRQAEGTFILRPKSVVPVTAPDEGVVGKVLLKQGDQVHAGDILLEFDLASLRAEQAALQKELDLRKREAERARANGALTEMRAAQSRADTLAAQLAALENVVQRKLIRSPATGVLLPGDLPPRPGAFIGRGSNIFQIRTGADYLLEVQLHSGNAREVKVGSTGEISFFNRPDRKYAVRVEQMEVRHSDSSPEHVVVLRCSTEGLPRGELEGVSGSATFSTSSASILGRLLSL